LLLNIICGIDYRNDEAKLPLVLYARVLAWFGSWQICHWWSIYYPIKKRAVIDNSPFRLCLLYISEAG